MTPEVKERIEQIRNGNVPEGYKKTKVGIFPCEWNVQPLSKLLEFKNGINADKEKFGQGTKLISVRDILSDYPITYETIQGSVDVNEQQMEEYGVKYGDILFQRSSENYEDAGTSNVYLDPNNTAVFSGFVIRGKKISEYNPVYLNALLRTSYVRKAIIRQAAGAQHINIGQESLAKVHIALADDPEQKKIAEILTAQDKVIELKEKLLSEKQRQKKHLMQQLITGKIRLPGFSENWATVELEEVFDYVQPTPYLVKSTNYSNSYLTPVLTAGKTFVLGYTDEVAGIYHDLPVVIFDDFTTDSKYVDFPFKAKSSAMKILKIKDGYNLVFAYEAMQMINFTVGGHERHWISKYSKLTIDAPCLEEQDAIANVISIIDKELALLQQDLEQEKQKKKALMQLLLTGIVRV